VIPAGQSGKLVATVRTRVGERGPASKNIFVTTDVEDAGPIQLTISFRSFTPIAVQPNNRRFTLSSLGNQQVEQKVRLKRTDGKPLAIEKVTTEPPWFVDVAVKTGRTGLVELIFSNPEYPLQPAVAGVVVLKTNHPEQPELRIPVSVFSRAVIAATPNKVLPPAEADDSVSVRLVHVFGKRFDVTSIEPSHPELFSASMVTPGNQPTQRLEVRFGTSQADAAGRPQVEGQLILHTTDPQQSRVMIPVRAAFHR
jgi:hypothetical protein